METFNNYFSNRVFEPTITIFKNALIISYKKVGTRYFSILASLPHDIHLNKKQIEFTVIDNLDSYDILEESLSEQSKINYGCNNHYILTQFDLNKYFYYDRDVMGFNDFTSTKEMFKYLNVNSYNELLFENKNRDIIFLIRDPLKRILSGITQILFAAINDFCNNEDIISEIKFYSKLTDEDIKKLLKLDKSNINDSLSLDELNIFYKVFEFLIEKKWNLILGDIHTENYLYNYIELIQNVSDRNKIKIIDLEQCSSNKSKDFFSNLRGDNELYIAWDFLERNKESNKYLYDIIFEKYINDFDKFKNSSLKSYLNPEYKVYNSLINSSYFVNLED